MSKFTPCLWFDDQAEEAAEFYTSVFKNSRVVQVSHYGEAAAKASGRPLGSVMTVVFELEGQRFMALNGGPVFTFSPAISFMVDCATQEELDELWGRLSDGGQEVECGWLTDRFGVSWQIVPAVLGTLMEEPDEAKRDRVMKALLQMTKPDIATLKAAAE